MHPLDLFAIPFPYRISVPELTQHYIALQKKWHPDRFVTASADDQKRAMEEASRINQAYQTLKDPLRRYESILTYLNAPLEQEASRELLEQQMAYREWLESMGETEQADFRNTIIDQQKTIEPLFHQAIEERDMVRAVALFQWATYLTRLFDHIDRKITG